MTQEEFKELKRGDIVRNLGDADSYVIEDIFYDSNGKGYPIAVRTLTLSNPSEWILVE